MALHVVLGVIAQLAPAAARPNRACHSTLPGNLSGHFAIFCVRYEVKPRLDVVEG
jgi:hypothetical protein